MITHTKIVCFATSGDGVKIVACVENGGIIISQDSGLNWQRTLDDRHFWQSAASSTNGVRLAASTSNGLIYTSSNSGISWNLCAIPPVRLTNVALSGDGSKLVVGVCGDHKITPVVFGSPLEKTMVDSSGKRFTLGSQEKPGPINTSSDLGVTWVASPTQKLWTGVAVSADGNTIVVCAKEGSYISSNSGVTWTPRRDLRPLSNIVLSGNGRTFIATADIMDEGLVLLRQLCTYTLGCMPLPEPISLTDKSCCICFVSYDKESAESVIPMYINPCGHTVCKNCASTGLLQDCPMCRKKIVKYEPITPLDLDGYSGKKLFFGGRAGW
jgi:hypothetical protein